MRSALQLLAIGLSTQTALAQVQIRVVAVFPGGHQDTRRTSELSGSNDFANALQDAGQAGNALDGVDLGLVSARPQQGYAGALSSGDLEHAQHRELFIVLGVGLALVTLAIIGIVLLLGTVTFNHGLGFFPSISAPITMLFDASGTSTVDISIDTTFLNADQTGLCDECSIVIDPGTCLSGDCAGYEAADTVTVVATVMGDPHMVGLLGQKIDWVGEDNGWYCLLNDGSDFHVNVRLTAPMPIEFPDRQLISAISILTDDGLHSLVIEVKNPYITDTEGCLPGSPCLANGGLRILVDGVESSTLQAPAENAESSEGSEMFVSAANLPAECRPFGGDRIWATQFEEMMSGRRQLRSSTTSFPEWIMQPETLAAPTWCAEYLAQGEILSTRSGHATFRVETPMADVRVNVGVNYQDQELFADGSVMVPELEFWQIDCGFDGLQVSENVAGLMGDTARYVFDADGEPVTSGLGALHAPVESYRVAGPFARDFEKMQG